MAATHHHLDGRDCLTDTDLTIDVFTGLEAVDIASRGIRHLYADEIEMLADLAGLGLLHEQVTVRFRLRVRPEWS